MKLGKRTRLVIVIGIFVIALIALNMVHSQRVNEQNQLKQELTQVQVNLQRVQLEQLSTRKAELEEELSQATSQLEAAKTILSQPTGNIAATSILFDVAKTHGLEVTEVTSPGPASESIAGVNYSVVLITAKVQGDAPTLVSFITELNHFLTTGTVKSVTITIPEPNSEEKALADINLVVYSYTGD